MAAGAGGAEDDMVFAGVTSEEQGEGGLDESVEGEPVGGGEGAEGGS